VLIVFPIPRPCLVVSPTMIAGVGVKLVRVD
jgi:hypothetical protein